MAFFVVDRYRFPLAPMLAPFAGLTIARFWGALRSRQRAGHRLVSAALLAAGLLALLHLRVGPWRLSVVTDEVRGRYEALEYHRRAAAWERLSRPDRALESYERALVAAPGHVPSRLRQCELLLADGRAAEAAEVLRTLLSVTPELEDAQRLLAEAESRLQK